MNYLVPFIFLNEFNIIHPLLPVQIVLINLYRLLYDSDILSNPFFQIYLNLPL